MKTFQEKIQDLIITHIKQNVADHNNLKITDEKLLYTLENLLYTVKNLLKHDECPDN